MLPTFVIGLREGLEAALIVGIVAAFLRQRGQSALLRWVWAGVGLAVALCVAGGIALEVLSKDLPQKQQEGLETVVGVIAVAMVTYMVVWMRRHSRELKGQLEGAAEAALAAGSGMALVAMAFLAVLREGFETVVFLLAAFNQAQSGSSAGLGAALGIAVALALGYGIYRGGITLNLAKFFRVTGVVLVLVAAGLVVSALRTAHEAGWLNIGQQSTVDLSGVVRPGSVQASLLTGILGIQPQPVLIEVIGWFVYLIPVVLYVVWPSRWNLARGTVRRLCLISGAGAAIAAIVVAVAMPGHPAADPVSRSGALSAQVVRTDAVGGVVRATPPGGSGPVEVTVRRGTPQEHSGIAVDEYTGSTSAAAPSGRPTTLSYDQVAKLNGGRLPLGVQASAASAPVSYQDTLAATFWVQPDTGRVIDASWTRTATTTAHLSVGPVVLPAATTTATSRFDPAAVSTAVTAADHDLDARSLRSGLTALAIGLGVLAALLLATALVTLGGRSARRSEVTDPTVELVNS
jgi:high-affinity iron transporter